MKLKAGDYIIFKTPWLSEWDAGEITKLVLYTGSNGHKSVTVPDRRGRPGWRADILYKEGVFKLHKYKKLKLNLP